MKSQEELRERCLFVLETPDEAAALYKVAKRILARVEDKDTTFELVATSEDVRSLLMGLEHRLKARKPAASEFRGLTQTVFTLKNYEKVDLVFFHNERAKGALYIQLKEGVLAGATFYDIPAQEATNEVVQGCSRII